PIFRLPRPDGKPLTVLAGPEANIFVGRYGDEFLSTQEFWQEFDNTMRGGSSDSVQRAREGEANRQRRARSSRSYSRARVLDRVPRMGEITLEVANWQPGQSIAVLPALQRIVAEQLGQLLVRFGPGDYLEDFITYLNTTISATMDISPDRDRSRLSSP